MVERPNSRDLHTKLAPRVRGGIIGGRVRRLRSLGFSPEFVAESKGLRPSLMPQDTISAVVNTLRDRGVSAPVAFIEKHPAAAELSAAHINTTFDELAKRGVIAANVVLKSPSVLNYSPEMLSSKFEGLKQMGFANPGALITREPVVLTMATGTLRARLQSLADLGFGQPISLIETSPSIVEYAPATIAAKLEGLRKMGFDEPIHVAENFPPVLTYSTVGTSKKIQYLDNVCALYDLPFNGKELAAYIPRIFATKMDKLRMIVHIIKAIKPNPNELTTAALQRILRSSPEDLALAYGSRVPEDNLHTLQLRTDMNSRLGRSRQEKRALIVASLPKANRVRSHYFRGYPLKRGEAV